MLKSDMWNPNADIKILELRANVFRKIRAFFQERAILEVDTPLLSSAATTDVHLQSFSTQYFADPTSSPVTYYLQTSPEFAMKRLLAAGSGPIYQLCKAFRNTGELSRLHNPEFSLLEWYRPGFDHHLLMDEVEVFLSEILGFSTAQRVTYQQLIEDSLHLNPHTCSLTELAQKIRESKKINMDFSEESITDYLMLWMSHVIEPTFSKKIPTFVYDFPKDQAALAKLNLHSNFQIAERFEVYVGGIELANGFHELTDAHEQHTRFLNDLAVRKKKNYPILPIDEHFLKALKQGLPPCAGVALGVDRLILLAANSTQLKDVLSFSWERT